MVVGFWVARMVFNYDEVDRAVGRAGRRERNEAYMKR